MPSCLRRPKRPSQLRVCTTDAGSITRRATGSLEWGSTPSTPRAIHQLPVASSQQCQVCQDREGFNINPPLAPELREQPKVAALKQLRPQYIQCCTFYECITTDRPPAAVGVHSSSFARFTPKLLRVTHASDPLLSLRPNLNPRSQYTTSSRQGKLGKLGRASPHSGL